MYKLDLDKSVCCSFGSVVKDNFELWHRRLGHMNVQYMKELQKSAGIGFVEPSDKNDVCVVCCKGKQSKSQYGKSTSSSSHKLELVHADLCGPMEEKSISGSRYFFSLVDDYTHKTFVYFLKSKDEVVCVFKRFKAFVENQCGEKLKVLRTDNGGEFCNKELQSFLQSSGIQHQTTIPYNPQQNGLCERMNRTIVESVLLDFGLPKRFWAEAVNTAVYLINRSPTKALSGRIPETVWTGRQPNLLNLRVFGSKAMVHVPKQKRKKFDPTAQQCMMVGYCETQTGYRVYNPVNDEVFSARDCIFDESCKYLNNNGDVQFFQMLNNEQSLVRDTTPVVSDSSEIHSERISLPLPNEVGDNDSPSDEDECSIDETIVDAQVNDSDSDYCPDIAVIQNCESRRSERAPKSNRKEDFVYSSIELSTNDPLSVEEALSCSDSNSWRQAMKDEYEAIMANETWTLCNLPAKGKALNSKWVFKTKLKIDGSVQYKARLVVKGCAQREGLDYEETYAPVVKYSSIRYLLALAVQYDMYVEQMDAVSAFLQGELRETVYMLQPENFADGSGKVCKLKKALYGLKQAGRAWNQKLDKVLVEIGMTRSKADRCIYHKIDEHHKLFVAVYVDDFLILSTNKAQSKSLKVELAKRFQMKDIGEVQSILGFRITRDREKGILSLDQQEYITRILEKFNMSQSNPVATPIDINVKLDKNMSPTSKAEIEDMKKIPFQEAVGSLLYAAQARPDIAYAVNLVSRFSNNPGKQHWVAVKRIFRYLKGTIGAKLNYRKSEQENTTGFSDADWASDLDERKSTTGYIFLKGGGAITWPSRKQQTVALSSTEAEYMALSAACQEALWLRKLDVELSRPTAIPIFCDSQSAINLSKTDSYHPRTKHIDVRHHFIKEKVAASVITINQIGTDQMIADALTKGLPKLKHQQHREEMGISINSSGSVGI